MGVKIKDLLWQDSPIGLSSKSSAFFGYTYLIAAGRMANYNKFQWRGALGQGVSRWFDTMDEAKEAANADFKGKVLSALDFTDE